MSINANRNLSTIRKLARDCYYELFQDDIREDALDYASRDPDDVYLAEEAEYISLGERDALLYGVEGPY